MKIKKLHEDVNLPEYKSAGAAGMDLEAYLPEGPVLLAPRCRRLVPCGFAVAIPEGFEGQVRPRSGLAMTHGITVLNAPGTIDSDYRGEMCVLLYNAGSVPVAISNGMRIAQLVIAPVTRIDCGMLVGLCGHEGWELVDERDETLRGEAGFGSTGV